MRTVLTLLHKDWIRIIRNPIAWVILFVLPLVVTFIMGAAFGGDSSQKSVVLKVLVIDEDQSFVGEFLKGLTNSSNSDGQIRIDFVSKEDGSDVFLENKHNALLIIPEGYSESIFEGESLEPIKLIKNPTQSIMPHVIEDLLLTAVQGVDVLRSPIKDELSEIVEDIKAKDKIDVLTVSRFMLTAGDKMKAYEKVFFEPLVALEGGSPLFDDDEDEAEEADVAEDKDEGGESETSIFAFVLPMMTSFFLFFGAESSARDIYREAESKNLFRFMVRSQSSMPLVLSKVLFSFCFILLSSIFLYTAAALIFGIHWASPLSIILLSSSYALLVSGIGFFFIAICGNENRAQLWSNFFIFFLAFAGGSIFSASALPGFLQNYITPFLPNFWYVSAIHSTQGIRGDYSMVQAIFQLVITGAVLVWFSSLIIQRRIRNNQFPQ